jgi:hypothetical protein
MQCNDSAVGTRFHEEVSVLAPGVTTSSSTSGSICNCEFDCKDANGLQVDVVVKVKMYCDQIRSGSFQKRDGGGEHDTGRIQSSFSLMHEKIFGSSLPRCSQLAGKKELV